MCVLLWRRVTDGYCTNEVCRPTSRVNPPLVTCRNLWITHLHRTNLTGKVFITKCWSHFLVLGLNRLVSLKVSVSRPNAWTRSLWSRLRSGGKHFGLNPSLGHSFGLCLPGLVSFNTTVGWMSLAVQNSESKSEWTFSWSRLATPATSMNSTLALSSHERRIVWCMARVALLNADRWPVISSTGQLHTPTSHRSRQSHITH